MNVGISENKQREESCATQVDCARKCYGGYKGNDLSYMLSSNCPMYKKWVDFRVQKEFAVCWIFESIFTDVNNALKGKRLNDGITYPLALKEIAELGLEKIPREAYEESKQ